MCKIFKTKKYISLISLVMIVLITLVMFSGCAIGKEKDASESEASAINTDDDFSKQITIKVVDNSTGLTSSDDFTNPKSKFYDERWEYVCNKFNVKIEYVPVTYATWADQLRTMLSTGSLPDVGFGALSPAEYQKYTDQGLIKSVSMKTIEKFPNLLKSLNAVTGKDAFKNKNGDYIAFPRPLDLEGVSTDYTYQFVYRKDWAKNAGVELKDAYTLQEMYDMFSKVQAKYPDALMYNSITPNNLLQLGMYQYVDMFAEGPKGNFRLNADGSSYEFIAAKSEAVDGLKWIKKFYDAGFVHPEYTTLPIYEARTEFNNGKTFSYWDGSDLSFFCNTIKSGFNDRNPELKFEDSVDIGLLLNNEGKYLIKDSGNFWSEIFFNEKISDEVLTRFLHVYDFLCSDEGMNTSFFGLKDKHYKLEDDGTVTNIREINPDTGLPEQFNLKVPDTYMMVYHGPMAGTSLFSKDNSLDKYGRTRIVELFKLREDNPHVKSPYDYKVSSYDSRDFSAFTGNAFKELNLLISTSDTEADLVGGWEKFLSTNKVGYEKIVQELNKELLGK